MRVVREVSHMREVSHARGVHAECIYRYRCCGHRRPSGRRGQVCFVAPQLPAVSADGRLHNTVLLNWPTGDQWGLADSYALGRRVLVGAMESDTFPLWMWRADFAAVRDHVAHAVWGGGSRRWQRAFSARGPRSTRPRSAFDAA